MRILIVALLLVVSSAQASEIKGSWQDEITLDTGTTARQTFTWTFSSKSASFRQQLYAGTSPELRDTGFYDYELLTHNGEKVLKLTASHRIVVAYTDKMAQGLSAANFCGHADWQKNVPKDVTSN